MADVKVLEQKHVIVLSDNTEKLPTNNLEVYEIEVDNDEVNNPIVFTPPTVRHKLSMMTYHRHLQNENQQMIWGYASLTWTQMANFDLGMKRVETCHNPKKFNLPSSRANHDVVGSSTRSAYGSSVGSNSPIGWLPNVPNWTITSYLKGGASPYVTT